VPEGTDMNSVDLSHIHSPNPLIGTPKQIIEQLKPFIDLGVVSFQLKNEGFPDTTSLHLLVEEVLPRIHS
jgi:alkanesulfonate monooxygenase SsuD/methylene tetrahydromethanopterin reductase-like flavin-dependent oxidoreductase (luciferase family)